MDQRQELVDVVTACATERLAWEAAGTCILETVLRDRFIGLAIEPTPDVALAIMAAALLVAEYSEEFGGDARDVLGELALVGLGLLTQDPQGT